MISSIQSELDALCVGLRRIRGMLRRRREREREKVFAQFEDLVGVEAFDALGKAMQNILSRNLRRSVTLFAVGREPLPNSLMSKKTPKLAVEKTSTTPEPYGGVFAEYGIVLHNQHN